MTTEEMLDEYQSSVHRICLILHRLPKEAMTLTKHEMDQLYQEHIDLTGEMNGGKPRVKLYENDRLDLQSLREMMDT